MYKFDSRVRYSETDSRGYLTMEALLDYFQDCSSFHSEDLGLGVDYLLERGIVWVLSSWQIVVERMPGFGEKVTIGTAPYDFKGCFGSRNFALFDANGEYLAKASTLWTLIDIEHFKPARMTEEMKERYVVEEKLPMDYAGRKINIPEGGADSDDIITVRPVHLDTNYHVNNGQYVRMAAEYLPEGFEVGQMRAEYKKQAVLNDRIKPYVVFTAAESGKKLCTVSLNDKTTGEAYAVVEFLEK